MKRAVIIVAAGKGSRFGAKIPKQFLLLNGKPIYIHTIEQFLAFDPSIQIILVLPWQTTITELTKNAEELSSFFDTSIYNCKGGMTRFDSVKNGLREVKDSIEVVAVHDAVRPLVSQRVITDSFQTAEQWGSAIPTLPLKNSIRKLTEQGSQSVNRSDYRLVQTPQCFLKNIIEQAYLQENKGFTDDASVVEAAGHKIKMVEGNFENIKITTPPDLLYAEFLLQKQRRED